jgi:hypothetical protein
MPLFSQRKGLKPIEAPLQLESMDAALRNGLWNCLHIFVWANWQEWSYSWTPISEKINTLVKRAWFNYFKIPLDQAPEHFPQALQEFRKYFFKSDWNEVFDFIEFVYSNGPDDDHDSFRDFLNDVLKTENSGYRFMDGQFVEITSEDELQAISDASQTQSSPVNTHIRRAVELLSDRKTPDYRNSIKESISAVEALCQILTKDSKATLGKALGVLESSSQLHGALKSGFASLYGYTSDEDGIRHAMLDESDLTFTDAKYMLVSCSGFVNYLVGKAVEAGIKIENP